MINHFQLQVQQISVDFLTVFGGGEEDIQVIQLDPQEGPQAYLASIRLPQIDFVPARLRP